MFNSIEISDMKFILIFTYFIFLYYRKKRTSFLNIGLCGYVSFFITVWLQLDKGAKAIVLILGLVVGFVLSYKELELLEKEGVDAKSFLKPDVFDFVVLILFVMVWIVIKATY